MQVPCVKTWEIAARLENVDRVCCEISTWLEEQGLLAHLFPLELLAREGLNNAILHGCALNPAQQVHCEIHHDLTTLRFTVSDPGPGFNWQARIRRGLAAKEAETGRGIQFYFLYADTVEFNSRGNQVTLTRQIIREGTHP